MQFSAIEQIDTCGAMLSATAAKCQSVPLSSRTQSTPVRPERPI